MESLTNRTVRDVEFSGAVLLAPASFLFSELPETCRLLEGHVDRHLQEEDLLSLLLMWKKEAGIADDVPLHVLLVQRPGDEKLSVFGGGGVLQLGGLCAETATGTVDFTLVPTNGMISPEELFKDLIHLVLSSKKLSKLILLPLGKDSEALDDAALLRILEDLGKGKTDSRILFLELWPTPLGVAAKQSMVPSLARLMGFRAG